MSAAAGRSRRIGIDVGGTKVQGVAVGPDGIVVATAHRDTPRGDGSLPQLIGVLADIADELGHQGIVGVGVTGLVTHDGVLRAAPNLDGVADFAVGALLAEQLAGAHPDDRGRVRGRVPGRVHVEVEVDSDATCALIAEWQLGIAKGVDDVIMVTLGTGIGGGVVAGGAVQRGANGFVGEFGHMVVDPDGPPCPCGRRGCWERYASGTGLAMLARTAAIGGRLHDVVAAAGGDAQDVRGEHVQSAARTGDPEALAVIDDFGRWVALGLSNLTNALDPAMFVLGGGLATGADLYLEPIERWFGELIYQPALRTLPRIEFATLGPLAGAVGAALLTR